MGVKDTANLAMIPAAYAESKVYSVLPSDGNGDFTFTRSGLGTRINKGGYIETMGNNVPRLNYRLDADGNPTECAELLLEESRTNYALDSNNISVWTNTTSGGSITSTANYAISPDGAKTATRLQMTATSYAMKNESTTSIVGDYSATIYLKSNTSSNQEIAIYGRNTPVTTYIVTPQWQRFEINGSALSGQASYINFGVNIGVGSDSTLDVLAWGGQIEAGSYATSIITTTSFAVTRNKDSATKQPFGDLASDYPITLYAKTQITEVGNTILSLNNTSNQNYYLVFYFSSSTQVGVLRRDLSLSDSDFFNYTYSVGDVKKIALKFISATAYKLYIDGIEIANVSSGSSIPFNHDDISLGQLRITGDTGARNPIDEFFIWNKALTDAEMIEITTP